MNSLANKMNVMNLLGTGLSVTTLLDRANLTMGELCELADQYPDLHNELKRWYKRYEFTAKKEIPVVNYDKPLETKEETEKPVKRSKKKVVKE